MQSTTAPITESDRQTYQPEETVRLSLSGSHQERASRVFEELDHAIPDPVTLERITEAALAARWQYHSAAVHKPTDVDLAVFFDLFVQLCAAGPQSTESVNELAADVYVRNQELRSIPAAFTDVNAA